MKSLMTVLVLSIALPTFASTSQEDEGREEVCSASAVYADGSFREFVRVECDDDFAGQCVQQIAEGQSLVWKIVDAKICDQAAANQK